jgi:MraZ protein
MFLSSWSLSLDGQGRLALPLSFRHLLREGLIVTRGFERCLQVFPRQAWQPLAQRVSNLPVGLEPARSLRRLLFAEAYEAELDSTGTIQLPERLLTYAHLRQHEEIVVAGLDTYFEIWSRPHWHMLVETLQVNAAAIAERTAWDTGRKAEG